jgi:outer membrane protein
VNGFIESFGEKNQYKLILGTTESGSILYGNKGDDLTDEITKNLNEQYKKNVNK